MYQTSGPAPTICTSYKIYIPATNLGLTQRANVKNYYLPELLHSGLPRETLRGIRVTFIIKGGSEFISAPALSDLIHEYHYPGTIRIFYFSSIQRIPSSVTTAYSPFFTAKKAWGFCL